MSRSSGSEIARGKASEDRLGLEVSREASTVDTRVWGSGEHKKSCGAKFDSDDETTDSGDKAVHRRNIRE